MLVKDEAMSIVKGQGGFTVIEIVMALAITGLILPIVGSAIFQMERGIPGINSEFTRGQGNVSVNWGTTPIDGQLSSWYVK